MNAIGDYIAELMIASLETHQIAAIQSAARLTKVEQIARHKNTQNATVREAIEMIWDLEVVILKHKR